MEYKKSPFRSNIDNRIKGPIILLFIFLQAFVNSITNITLSPIASYFGLELSTVIFFSQLGAVGMIAIIPIFYRLRLYFRKADLLYLGFGFEAVISLLCYSQNSSTLLLGCNFFMGILKSICLFDFISMLVRIYPSMKHRALFYGVYYTIARTVSQLSNVIIAKVVDIYDWHAAYLLSFITALLCIVLCMLFFHRQRLHRKVPLYQVEWESMILFIVAASSLCYVLTFGRTKDWFDSKDIISVIVMFLLSTGIFIYRQLHVKRPYWNLHVFQIYKQILLGVSLMIIMYLFSSTSTILNLFAKYNFANEENYLSDISGITFCAYLIGFPIAGSLLYRGISKRLVLCVGFLSYSFSLFYFYHIVQTSLSFNQLIPLYFLQGIAYSFTITTLSTFTATNILRKHNLGRIMGSVFSRYIVGSFAGFSLYTNWLYRGTVMHKTYLIEKIDNNIFIEELNKISNNLMLKGLNKQSAIQAATALIEKRVGLQAMLVTMKEISFYISIIAFSLSVIVVFIKKLKMHEIALINKYGVV